MKIIHHNDADGWCAAAIVRRELSEGEDISPSDFIEYSYYKPFNLKDVLTNIECNERVYIVDVSLNDDIINLISNLVVTKGCKVFHFDHHKSTFDEYNKFDDSTKRIWESVIHIYDDTISGCMITYAFACMNTIEKADINNVNYEFAELHSHVMIQYKGNSREYAIPLVVRYVDDNDTWRNSMAETKFFSVGFLMEENIKPYSDRWNELIESPFVIGHIIDNGTIASKFQDMMNSRMVRSNSFVTKMNGLDILCVNSCQGNSRLFGNEFDKYPGVCKFGYNGKTKKWIYTLYGSTLYDTEDKIDLTEIASQYGGGGHKKACGFQLDYNLFDETKREDV